jgi:hypothetical protein
MGGSIEAFYGESGPTAMAGSRAPKPVRRECRRSPLYRRLTTGILVLPMRNPFRNGGGLVDAPGRGL